MTRRLCTLLLAIVVGAAPAALAQQPKAGDKAELFKPKFTIQTKSRDKTSKEKAEQTEAGILANIDNQKMIINLTPVDDPEYPKQLLALADFYWDLSDIFGRKSQTDELEQAIYDAEDKGETAKLAKLKAEQQGYLNEQAKNQELTVEKYREVIQRFPKSRDLDEVRYYLGYNLNQMGKAEEAVAAYSDLIREHPTSKYIPDALVNVGEHYFNLNDFSNALALYEHVNQYPNVPIYGYAVFKQAWCHYNLRAYDLSLDRFLQVLKIAEQQQAAGMKSGIELRAEALNDLVLPFAKVGKPTAAIAFFKKYSPDKYLDMSSRLAAIYTEETEYDKSNRLLRSLIKEAMTATIDGKDVKYMVVRFQRQVVDNAHRKADKIATVEEIRELIRLFEEIRGAAPPDFIAKEEKDVAAMILEIATGYHNEYKHTKAQLTLEATQMLYDEYLRLFKDADNAYIITWNNATLMYLTGKFEQAAGEFEKVIEMKPDGEYTDQAAEFAVLSAVKAQGGKKVKQNLKSESEGDLKPVEIDAAAMRFANAVDRWMEVIARKGLNPENADNVPPARYLAAKVYYDHNHFDEAAKRFADFVAKHPDHEFIEDAARYVLSAYNHARDVENLQKWAVEFEKNPTLMATSLKEDTQRIKREFNFLSCFKPEKDEKYLTAAKCFSDYQKNDPKAPKAPSALYNAALNYFKAKRVEESIQVQARLYEEYRSDELAPMALYAIGDIYRETTVYDEAARMYEIFVANHADHPQAEKALRFASIFRKTLGEYDKAVENLELYLSRFKNNENAPMVHLDIVLIRQTQDRPTWVIKAVAEHLKRFKKEPASVRLQVLNARAKAYRKLDKDKDAAKAFDEVLATFKTLKEDDLKDLTLPAVSAVAEARFQMGEGVLRRARFIKLEGKKEKDVQNNLKKKLELMNECREIYNEVISYGHAGWTIAAYTQLGLAFRDLADNVENTPVPRSIMYNEEVKEQYLTYMAEQAEQIRAKAIENYKQALAVAREHHWFNEYSERAEQAIAQLDLTDASIKEFRLRPDHTAPNSGLPNFKQELQ